jgi:hypothetical protein
MSKLNTIGYNLKDVSIIPSVVSYINSRKEVNPYMNFHGRNVLPIFVAPMRDVTDENNYKVWMNNKVIPVVPRSIRNNVSLEKSLEIAKETFVSLSKSEGKTLLKSEIKFDTLHFICIDLANGHMNSLLTLCKGLKQKYGDNIEIMTGNIANPKIYPLLCESGIDWIRSSIGSGARCTSSNTTGVHYATATLIDKLCEEREAWISNNPERNYTKIIMDGGISWYDDINKSLAIGADAVMIGRLFAECEEACGEVLWCSSEDAFIEGIGYAKEELDDINSTERFSLKPYRWYRGMSHRSMQKETGGDGSKVSEGICKPVEVKHTVKHWLDNVEAYLRSAMSYTNSKTLSDFRQSELIILGGCGASVYSK